jgi:hypothetical protein
MIGLFGVAFVIVGAQACSMRIIVGGSSTIDKPAMVARA